VKQGDRVNLNQCISYRGNQNIFNGNKLPCVQCHLLPRTLVGTRSLVYIYGSHA
jgi:cytochrome c